MVTVRTTITNEVSEVDVQTSPTTPIIGAEVARLDAEYRKRIEREIEIELALKWKQSPSVTKKKAKVWR